MDAKTTIKAWRWFTITLAILNVALCISIWFNPQKNYPPRPERPDEFIISKLHFSDEQLSAFEKLRNRHHDSVVVLQNEGKKMRRVLFDNLKEAAKTEVQMDSVIIAIGNNQKEIEFVTYRHFRQLREICNDSQKKVFDDIIQDVLKRMSGRPHRPDGPSAPGDNSPKEDHDGPPPPVR